VGAQPEHTTGPDADESVTWIGRDRSLSAPHAEQGELARTSEPVPVPLPAPSGDVTPAELHTPADAPWSVAGAPLPTRWAAIGVGIVVALLAVLGVVRYANQSGGTPLAGAVGSIPLVTARAPGLTPVTASVTFTGAIQARYDLPIGSQGDAGRITAVYVDSGEWVHRGQLLARLDDSVLRPQVARLSAALDEARANAALAQAEYARAEAVASSGALSAEAIEQRRATAVTAAAEVKVAAAQLAEYQERLAQADVRAPADGLVLTRSAEVGQIATPGGNALFRLAKGGEMEMRGQVAEQDLPSLKVGQSAVVHLIGIDRPFRGRVRLLGAVIDPNTRLGEIRVALENDPQLRPGAFARGAVTVGRGLRPVLPQTAVLTDAESSYVYVVDDDGRIARRNVRVADTTAQGIVIGAGLTGRERIVMTAAAFLRPGERVSVAPASAAAAATGSSS